MLRGAIFMVLMSFLPAAAHAAGGNIFFGYNYGRTDVGLGNTDNTNGWNGQLEGGVLPWISVVADLTGQYGNQTVPGSCPVVGFPCAGNSADTSLHTFLFGPRVSVSLGKLRPFAHALFGAGRAKISTPGFSDSDLSFASAVGGGVDYHWHGPIGWRFQGDMLHTSSFGGSQNNFRFATGLVLSF